MLPTIGLMIAAYIFLRCLEILATLERIPSRANRGVIAVVAVAVVLLCIIGGYGLLTAGVEATQMLRPLMR
jgi:hypothetical protein